MRLVLFMAPLLFLAGCASIGGPIGCKIPRDPVATFYEDRCYIDDDIFLLADQLYSKFGSLNLVKRHLLVEEQLLECEVNEALYRLRKVHNLP